MSFVAQGHMQRLSEYASPADGGPEKKQDSDLEQKDSDIGVQQVDVVEESGLRRALKGRHVSLISLSSVIGAGCFYSFGLALSESGPLGALIGFGVVGMFDAHKCMPWAAIPLGHTTRVRQGSVESLLLTVTQPGFMVWALMQSIGEVTTSFPIAGGFIEVRNSACPY